MPPPFAILVTQRPGRAAKLFDDALKRDPTLIEARMRAARIRAIDNPSDTKAVSLLESIAADAEASPFNYLAAVSRAEVARAQADREGAITWYERARTLHPRSAAAAIALSSLVPGRTVAFGALDADDPYYTYPCTVITAEVAAALSTWKQAVPRWPK